MTDVNTYQHAHINSDHYPLVAKIRAKFQTKKAVTNTKYDYSDKEALKAYGTAVDKGIEETHLREQEIPPQEAWQLLQNLIDERREKIPKKNAQKKQDYISQDTWTTIQHKYEQIHSLRALLKQANKESEIAETEKT